MCSDECPNHFQVLIDHIYMLPVGCELRSLCDSEVSIETAPNSVIGVSASAAVSEELTRRASAQMAHAPVAPLANRIRVHPALEYSPTAPATPLQSHAQPSLLGLPP